MSTPRPARALAFALAAATVAALATAGCAAPAPGSGARPAAEFLLSAGDSTYWIASDSARVRVRSSAMFLARFDGRLYEVYAADDDRSFYDAIFTSQRIYRRDLVDGDSVPVFDDAVVPTLARRYASTHPHEVPLGPEDESSAEPRTSATTEVSLVDVHGPYLTYDAHADIDVEGGAARHATRRTVVDLRSARAVSLVELFGAAAAESLVVEGRRRLAPTLDSVRALAADEDEAGARALHALSTFHFAPDNFGLAESGQRPAVTFVAVGRDIDGHAVTLPLPPVPVPGAEPAWWNGDVRPVLPATSADSAESRWRLAGADVVARRAPGQDVATLTLRATGRGEWPLTRVPTPVRQLYALDRPALTAAARRALTRAFNESALYGDQAISAAYRRRAPSAERQAPRRTNSALGARRSALVGVRR